MSVHIYGQKITQNSQNFKVKIQKYGVLIREKTTRSDRPI